MKPTHQEAANFFKPKEKFVGEKKKKNKGTKNSLVDKTKLDVSSFTSNSYPPNSFIFFWIPVPHVIL